MNKKWKTPDPIRTSRNVLAAFKDIEKLNKSGYNFLYLLCGFIAHYNYYGFIQYYRDHSLKQDFLDSSDVKRSRRFISDPFFTEHEQSEYYRNRYEIIELIKAGLDI